ncbi:hypothetical protein H5410_041011 [Solanum commersonii]|uniref:Zinc finger PMZ-type domain-containing protein n=1 Tax=Solanum commersonii TaxID=4109 RepID=A0A9J5XQL4_SOLCO|nr:hypothetical protein H5410_041011 [Solanum commersonii]
MVRLLINWNDKRLSEEDVSCRRFQHDEIACSHAVAAIRYRNKHREDYCSTNYSNKDFQDTYAIPIELLPCEST